MVTKTTNTLRPSYSSDAIANENGLGSNESLNSVSSNASSATSPLPRTASEMNVNPKLKGLTRVKSASFAYITGPTSMQVNAPTIRMNEIHAPCIEPVEVKSFEEVLEEWVAGPSTEGIECRRQVADEIQKTKVNRKDTLTICCRPLTTIPDCIAEMPHLTCLNLVDLKLTTLPRLPQKLEYLSINKNQLTEVPSNLPDSIKFLDASCNALTSLPDALPKNLVQFNISKNRISRLPALPDALVHLTISDNEVDALTADLPSGLKHLVAENNRIETIPSDLPRTLRYLNLMNNRVKMIPDTVWSLAENDPIFTYSDLTRSGADDVDSGAIPRGSVSESRAVSLRQNALDVGHEKSQIKSRLASGQHIPNIFL